MRFFVSGAEIIATNNQFVHSLQTARSEAIKGSGSVSLCPSADSLGDEPACGGLSYGAGWIVFFDKDGDGIRSSGDELIHQVEERSASFIFYRLNCPQSCYSRSVQRCHCIDFLLHV